MPITDYESENERIKRMFAQALALRQDSDTPQGKMISGHFVAPSWIEQLNPAINQALGGFTQGQAEKESKGLGQQMQDEYADWLKKRPQTRTETTETSEEIPGTIAPGPQQEAPYEEQAPGFRGPPKPQQGQAGPLLKTRMVQQQTQVEPTDDENLNWAGQGMKNPLSRTLASEYMKDQMIQGPERKMAREFKHQEADLQRMAVNQRQTEALKAKMDMLQVEMGRKDQSEENKLAIARMMDKTKRDIGFADAQARVDAAALKAKAAGQKVTPVPNNVMTKMSEAESAADGIQSAYSTFKPEYAGYLGGAGAWWGRNAPSPLSTDAMKEAAAWWQNYEDQGALIRRHALFGSAFTPGEQQAWNNATITKTTPPELIAGYLKIRADLSNKFYNKIRQQYTTVGYSTIADAFPERNMSFEPMPGGEEAPQITAPPTMRPTQPRQPQPPQPESVLPPNVRRIPGT